MKEVYVALIATIAFFGGYIFGAGSGQDSASNQWREAVLSVPDEACRYAVRDALKVNEINDKQR